MVRAGIIPIPSSGHSARIGTSGKTGGLKLSMAPDNGRVRDAKGYCLAAADRKHFVFFVEDADSVTVDLSGMPGSQTCVAVDAKADYEEIDRGNLAAGVHTLHLGTTSDWVLAVGDFSDQNQRDGSANVGNAQLPGRPDMGSRKHHP